MKQYLIYNTMTNEWDLRQANSDKEVQCMLDWCEQLEGEWTEG